jgi:hypothetical protein
MKLLRSSVIALALVAMVASAQAQTLRRHAKADQQALEALEKSHAADVQDSLEQVRFAAAKAPVETDKMGADDIAPAEPAKPNATISLSKNDTRGENSTIPSNDDTKAAVDDLMKTTVIITNGVNETEKARPKLVPVGYFKTKAAEGWAKVNEHTNRIEEQKQKRLEVLKARPEMVKSGYFHDKANPPPPPPAPGVKPTTVEMGGLKKLAQMEVDLKMNRSRAEEAAKNAESVAEHQSGACSLMGTGLDLAKEILAAEKGTEKTGMVDLIKVICPTLKEKYGKAVPKVNCAELEHRLTGYYDPKYAGAYWSEMEKGAKCCDPKTWPKKNFAIQLVTRDIESFWGTKLCVEEETDDNEEAAEAALNGENSEEEAKSAEQME